MCRAIEAITTTMRWSSTTTATATEIPLNPHLLLLGRSITRTRCSGRSKPITATMRWSSTTTTIATEETERNLIFRLSQWASGEEPRPCGPTPTKTHLPPFSQAKANVEGLSSWNPSCDSDESSATTSQSLGEEQGQGEPGWEATVWSGHRSGDPAPPSAGKYRGNKLWVSGPACAAHPLWCVGLPLNEAVLAAAVVE